MTDPLTLARLTLPAVPGSGRPGSITPGDPGAPVFLFPETPLGLQADMLLPAWTGISSYVYQREGQTPAVTITRGRQDGSTQAQPQTARFELNNRGGPFSQYNPTGPWYGQLGRNTPIRFSIPDQVTGLRMEDDTVSCAATAAIAPPTGNFEVRIDVSLTSGVASVLASQWALLGYAWAFVVNADGTLSLWWTTDDATNQVATSTQPLTWGGRMSLRVTYAHSSGLVSFYVAPAIDGTYSQLGQTVPSRQGGSGAVYNGNSPLQVGANSFFVTNLTGFVGYYGSPAGQSWAPATFGGMTGKVFEFRLYQGIGGSYISQMAFSAQAPGATSFADSQGNGWTLSGTATIDARLYRYHGELTSLPQRWDPSGSDVYVPVLANGLLRRAGQGAAGQATTPPLQSAMTRGWQFHPPTAFPAGWWPCEDGAGSSQIASGLTSGGLPMSFTTLVQPSLAANSDFPASSPIPTLNKSTWTGPVIPYTLPPNPAAVMRFLYEAPQGGDTDTGVIARFHTTGTCYRVDVQYGVANNGSLQIEAFDGSGNSLFASGFIDFVPNFGGVNGVPLYVSAELTASGGTITWGLWVFQPGSNAVGIGLSGTISGTIGMITNVAVNPKSTVLLNGSAVGQLSVQATWESLYVGPMAGPFNAWIGETDGLRFARLATEQGYSSRIAGWPRRGVAMGAQTAQTFVDLLTECEVAGNGMVCEARDSLSLRYRTLASMYNQVATVLSYILAQLGGGAGDMEPTDDDLLTVNDVLATRSAGSATGSSIQQQLTSGPMSIQDPPDGAGDYQQQLNTNVETDGQLGDAAGWAIHMGTVNEPRYPLIPVDLSRPAVAALYYAIAALDLGDYFQVTGPPVWLPPDTIKALIWEEVEKIGGFFHQVQFMTLPESPYEVLFAGTGTPASDRHASTAGSQLNSSATSSATSLSVATTSGPVWSASSADWPFDIEVGGERMTVTHISGSSSPQTFTVTRSVNGVVKAQAAGTPVSLFTPATLALV